MYGIFMYKLCLCKVGLYLENVTSEELIRHANHRVYIIKMLTWAFTKLDSRCSEEKTIH